MGVDVDHGGFGGCHVEGEIEKLKVVALCIKSFQCSFILVSFTGTNFTHSFDTRRCYPDAPHLQPRRSTTFQIRQTDPCNVSLSPPLKYDCRAPPIIHRQ